MFVGKDIEPHQNMAISIKIGNMAIFIKIISVSLSLNVPYSLSLSGSIFFACQWVAMVRPFFNFLKAALILRLFVKNLYCGGCLCKSPFFAGFFCKRVLFL